MGEVGGDSYDATMAMERDAPARTVVEATNKSMLAYRWHQKSMKPMNATKFNRTRARRKSRYDRRLFV